MVNLRVIFILYNVLHAAHALWDLSTADIFPLLQDANTPELFPMSQCGAFQLQEATIDQMQAAMSNGSVTSTQLVLCYLERAYQTQNYLRYGQATQQQHMARRLMV